MCYTCLLLSLYFDKNYLVIINKGLVFKKLRVY